MKFDIILKFILITIELNYNVENSYNTIINLMIKFILITIELNYNVKNSYNTIINLMIKLKNIAFKLLSNNKNIYILFLIYIILLILINIMYSESEKTPLKYEQLNISIVSIGMAIITLLSLNQSKILGKNLYYFIKSKFLFLSIILIIILHSMIMLLTIIVFQFLKIKNFIFKTDFIIDLNFFMDLKFYKNIDVIEFIIIQILIGISISYLLYIINKVIQINNVVNNPESKIMNFIEENFKMKKDDSFLKECLFLEINNELYNQQISIVLEKIKIDDLFFEKYKYEWSNFLTEGNGELIKIINKRVYEANLKDDTIKYKIISDKIFGVVNNIEYKILASLIMSVKTIHKTFHDKNDKADRNTGEENIELYIKVISLKFFNGKLSDIDNYEFLSNFYFSGNKYYIHIVLLDYIKNNRVKNFTMDFKKHLENSIFNELDEKMKLNFSIKTLELVDIIKNRFSEELELNENAEKIELLNWIEEECNENAKYSYLKIEEFLEIESKCDEIRHRYCSVNSKIGIVEIHSYDNVRDFLKPIAEYILKNIEHMVSSIEDPDIREIDMFFNNEMLKYYDQGDIEKITNHIADRKEIFTEKIINKIPNYRNRNYPSKLYNIKDYDKIKTLIEIKNCLDNCIKGENNTEKTSKLKDNYNKLYDCIKKNEQHNIRNKIVLFEDNKYQNIYNCINFYIQIIHYEIEELYELFKEHINEIINIYGEEAKEIIYLNYIHMKLFHKYDIRLEMFSEQVDFIQKTIHAIGKKSRIENHKDEINYIFENHDFIIETQEIFELYKNSKFYDYSKNKVEINYRWKFFHSPDNKLIKSLLSHKITNLKKFTGMIVRSEYDKEVNSMLLQLDFEKPRKITFGEKENIIENMKKGFISKDDVRSIVDNIDIESYRNEIETLIK